MTDSPERAWIATLALLGTHQMEEVVYSIKTWSDEVGGTGSGWLDAHVARTPLAGSRLAPRLATVAGQGLGAAVLYRLTRRSLQATRIVTTALCLGWAAAFCMHIVVSVRTRSAMPGLSTSLVPGLPGAAATIVYIWR